ncbi:MAG: carboxypeptidase regulatory-like domain-containing protein [Bacteroidota bacterium]|nr:carboxypeptidase regulatory-like domain-containing protein [Bacteroidota bacterium]
MKRFSILFLFICFLTVLLYSCQKDFVASGPGEISGVVTDHNNDPIKVEVSVDNNAIKDSTNASGYYYISGLTVGKHYISFSKKGYASFGQSITVSHSSAESSSTNGASSEVAVTQNISLSAINGKARGRVLGKNNEPVPNAKVIAYYDGFYPMADSITTDAHGVFSFAMLPLNSSVSFIAYDSTRTATGSMNWIVEPTSSETEKDLGTITISEIALRLIAYTGQGSMTGAADALVDTTSSVLTLTFSDNISEGLTKLRGGYVKLCGVEKDATVVYFGKKITITPVNNLGANRIYYIQYKVYASDIKNSSNSSLYFRTKPKATVNSNAAVISIIAGTNAKSLHLVTPCTGASDYTVYYKTTTSTEYLIHSTWDGSDMVLNKYFPSGTSIYVVPSQSGSVLLNAPASNIVTFTL